MQRLPHHPENLGCERVDTALVASNWPRLVFSKFSTALTQWQMLACSNTAWLQASLACTAKSAALFQKPFGHCFGRNAPDRSLWTSNKSSSFFTPGTCFTETASKHPCTETCWPCKQICQTYQSCQATQAVVFQCQTLQLLVPNLQVALVWHLDFSLDFSRTPHLLLSNIFCSFSQATTCCCSTFSLFLEAFVGVAGWATTTCCSTFRFSQKLLFL